MDIARPEFKQQKRRRQIMLTFAAVSLTLVLVALMARYVPVRRAAKVDPVAALRYE